MKDVEKQYEQLKKKGQATVENLVKWMKEAKLLEKAERTEEEAHRMFQDVEDKSHVTLEKFKAVMTDLNQRAQLSTEQLSKDMKESGGRFLDALKAASTAFFKALDEKKRPD